MVTGRINSLGEERECFYCDGNQEIHQVQDELPNVSNHLTEGENTICFKNSQTQNTNVANLKR